MPRLLLASSNPGKVREYRLLLDNLGYQIVTLSEQGISKVTTESGNTYAQNAEIKATTYAKLSQLITLADDSGLEVDALHGKPGIHSARFAGENATDADRVTKLLAMMDGIPWNRRTAHFKCIIAIATPEGKLELCQGKCPGIIAFEAKGKNGFGYDPIFYLPKLAKTMAEIPLEIKNQLSHRGEAAQRARKILNQFHN